MNYTKEIWEASFLYMFLNDKMYGTKKPMTCGSLLGEKKSECSKILI